MGLIIQSIIVYGIIIWLMTYFGHIAYKWQYPQGYGGIDTFKNKRISFLTLFIKSYYVIPIFVFCLFAAVRYRVGVDCESYKELFYVIQKFGSLQTRESIEFLYKYLCNVVGYLTGTHYLLLFVLAMLQIVLYYYGLKKHTYLLVFLSFALFFTNTYWSWMNGIRQNIAACAFVAVTPLIIKKKWINIALITFAAMLMHKSALIILPLSVLGYLLRNFAPNKYIQLGVLAMSFLFMNKFNNILSSISYLAAKAGYNERSITIYTELEESTRNFGARMVLLYIVYVICIFYYERMRKYFNSKEFNLWYNLHFIGICLTVVFYNNFTITRVLYYLVIFTPIIISHLLFYLYNNKKKVIFNTVLIILALGFMYTLYNSLNNPATEAFLYKFDI